MIDGESRWAVAKSNLQQKTLRKTLRTFENCEKEEESLRKASDLWTRIGVGVLTMTVFVGDFLQLCSAMASPVQ